MVAAEDRHGLHTARVVLVAVLTAQLVVLAATGVWLTYRYLPVATTGWSLLDHLDTTVGQTAFVGRVHRWTALAALATAVAAAVLVELDTRRRSARGRRPRAIAVAGPALVVLTFVAWFTGRLLPWDQLALWAVTVGTNLRGYGPILFDDRVKYVLTGSHEIGLSTMRFWFVVHAVALPVLFVASLAVVLWPRRQPAQSGDGDALLGGPR